MITESKGTPDIIKDTLSENLIQINKIIKLGIDDALTLSINKSINIGEKILSLKCNLNIHFYFNEENYNGNIKFQKCIESNFKDCEINIYIPKDFEKLRVYKSILHELTHLYELYQIRDIFDKTSWTKSKKLNTYEIISKNKGLIRYFRDIFYSSLSHEIRSNLSPLHIFLIGLNSKDEKYLRSELEKTSEWSRYKALSEFNPETYLNDLINNYDLDFILNSFNLFNSVLEIKSKPIENKENLIKYFRNWKRYFLDISNKYEYKINKKIKEVIESENNEYGTELYEDKILKYTDYLEDIQFNREIKIDELLKIDYLSYFENWNPVKSKEVIDWVEQNKYNLPNLWNKDLSEEENIEFMINYFTEFPDEMKTEFDNKVIAKPISKATLRNSAPVLQNIGNFNDFRSF
jgi:hypothetical protein